MLTSAEKRFVRYWEEQRKGGRWSYLLLYILAGTFIASIVLLFVLHMWAVDFEGREWLIPITSFVIITVVTNLTWMRNEKRFKTIIRREMENGKNESETGVGVDKK